MKITKTQLRQVIKEEISKAIEEGVPSEADMMKAIARAEKSKARLSFISKILDDMKSLKYVDQKFIIQKVQQLKDEDAELTKYAKLLAAIKKFKDSVRGKAPISSLIKDI